MFDGNHRTRRTIDLGRGGRSRASRNSATTSTKGKRNILEASKRRRQDRAVEQRKVHAALTLQRHVRGRWARQELWKRLSETLLDKSLTLEKRSSLWNFKLGLASQKNRQNEHEKESRMLMDYASQIQSTTTAATTTPPPPPPLMHRIVKATFRSLLRQLQTKTASPPNSAAAAWWSAHQSILKYALGGARDGAAAATTATTSSVSKKIVWQNVGFASGYRLAVQLMFQLLAASAEETSNHAAAAAAAASIQDLVCWSVRQVTPHDTTEGKALLVTFELLVTQKQKSTTTISNQANAMTSSSLMANLEPLWQVLTATPTVSSSSSSSSSSTLAAKDDAAMTRSLLTALVQEQVQTHAATILLHLLQQPQQPNANTNTNTATATTTIATLLPLIFKLYQESPHLQLLTGMVVRGESVTTESLLQLQQQRKQASSAAGKKRSSDADDESDSDDDDDMDSSKRSTSAQQQHHNRPNTSYAAAKLDYLTLPKLDKLSNERYTAWRHEQEGKLLLRQNTATTTGGNTDADAAAMIQVAQRLGDATLWIGWAQQLLLQQPQQPPPPPQASAAAAASAVAPSYDSPLEQAQACWIHLLSTILQHTTGLKARQSASSPFLAKLAFHETTTTTTGTVTAATDGGGAPLNMVELLWKLVRQLEESSHQNHSKKSFLTTPLLQAWSVFCDVYSHRLIAQYDDQFVQQYTTALVHGDAAQQQLQLLSNNNNKKHALGRRTCIMAKDVILQLRDELYDLYWNSPVRSNDVRLLFGNNSVDHQQQQQQQSLVPTEKMNPDECIWRMARARLLITGTKLWTALHERWSRLMRETPFCDETTWIFPSLAIHLENSVAGQRHRSSSIPMDIDPHDEADADHHNQQQQHHDDDHDDEGDDDRMDVDMDEAADAADVLAESFSDPKIARLLTSIPQALPFDRRFRLFQSLIANDKVANQNEDVATRAALLNMMRGEEFDLTSGRVKVNIRRDHLYDDSMQALNELGRRLKRRVQVSFSNQHGAQEAGIDGGGVFKEFIDDLIRDAFHTDNESTTGPYRLFDVTPLEMLAVNTSLPKTPEILSHYEFLGRVLGKAVYESILVDPQFCFPFLKSFLGQVNSMGDMRNMDPELHRNFLTLLSLTEDELKEQDLDFEITLKDEDTGKTRNVELIQGGRNVAVTKQNVIQYVHLFAYHRLNVETAAQTKAFLRGFRDLIPATWVRLFNPYELQKIISGDDSVRGINVAGLKKVMTYASGYHPSQPVVQWFWDIVEKEMTDEQQRKFLKFMTSCSRQPLLGFGVLDPPPCLQQIRIATALRETDNLEALAKQTPLPTASTCMNLLKLPNYPSKALMKWKLLAAIEADAGFELT